MNQPPQTPLAVDTARALETALLGFEEAWQKGEVAPPIEDFLRLENLPDSTSHALVEELIKVDLEYRWRSARPGVEHLLLGHYAERFKDCLPPGFPSVQLIREEYWVRQHWGDQPSIAEYVRRFPQVDALADRLRQVQDELGAEFADRSQPPPRAFVGRDRAATESLARAPSSLPAIPGYDILGILGRGGMAVVYRARELSLGRDVAIKMIRTGAHASDIELQRFRREAEAAAQLRHPNIVAIHHVGAFEGQPFCVMELVDGGSLADWLDGTPREAAEAALLISKLAKAIHVAHQAGIVHRDLKPANILLSPRSPDATPSLSACEPRIADFGLVKRLDLADGQTQTGEIVGTPCYMAPEQVDAHADISPATDVYALGTMLYELLTGRPPLRGSSSLDTLDLVRNQDPVPPRQLQPRVPRDLETICLKCLAKDVSRRYLGGRELAEDLDRFLDGQPIRARPANFVERATKWARRRPAAASLFAVIALASATLLAGGWSYNTRITDALRDTSAEKERADENFNDAYSAVNRMLDRVGFEALANIPGTEQVREELLIEAVSFYDELLARSAEQDVTFARHRQQAYQHLGLVRMGLDRFDEAEADLRRALELQQEIISGGTTNGDDCRALAQSHLNLALLFERAGRIPAAKERLQSAVDMISQQVHEIPALRVELALAYNNLANLLRKIGETKTAETMHLRAIALRRQLVDEAPDDKLIHGLAQSHFNLALLYQYGNRLSESKPHYEQAVAGFQPLADAHPLAAKYHLDLAECYSALAFISMSQGEPEAAITLHRQGLELRQRMADLYPGVSSYHDMVARSHHNLASVLQEQGNFDEAIASLLAAISSRERLVREAPDSPGFQLELAESQNSLALIYTDTGKLPAAKEMFMQAIDVQQRLLRQNPGEVRRASSLAATRTNFGNLLRSLGEIDASLEQHRLAIELLQEKHEQTPDHVEVRTFLLNASGSRAVTLGNAQRYAEAIADWNRVVELADAESRRAYRLWRGTILARVDHAAAVLEADSLLADNALEPNDQYNLACIHALAAETAGADQNLSQAEREQLRSKYANRAIELLADEAMRSYLRDPTVLEHCRKDADLAVIRERGEFQALLAGLQQAITEQPSSD